MSKVIVVLPRAQCQNAMHDKKYKTKKAIEVFSNPLKYAFEDRFFMFSWAKKSFCSW